MNGMVVSGGWCKTANGDDDDTAMAAAGTTLRRAMVKRLVAIMVERSRGDRIGRLFSTKSIIHASKS
jgi:hypothetical protein